MKKLKVAFFGTSDRSVPILNTLHENFDLVLCVTKSDVTFGRHQDKKPTGVKKWAQENGVKFVTIDSFKAKGNDEDDAGSGANSGLEKVLSQLRSVNVQYGIVADFSFIIPNELIEFFDKKLLNIHFSLLPKYRGASPVQSAILNGDEVTGVTYQLVAEKLDAGDIISQIGYNVTSAETSGDLYRILFELSAENLPKVLEEYHEGRCNLIKQDEEAASYSLSPSHPKSTYIFKEDALINWKEAADVVERKVRAYNPWPIAWTYLKELEKNKRLAHKVVLKKHVDKELKVKIFEIEINEDKKLLIETLQVEGKSKFSWNDFNNGYLEIA